MGKITEYLKNYSNKSTAQGYQSAVYTFIDTIYGKQRHGKAVTAPEKGLYESLVDRYLSERRNFAEDMAAFAVSLSARPPQAARVTFTYVREFFSHYNLDLHKKDQKFIRTKLPKGTTARTVELDLDTETIRTILQHVDIKGKAMILVGASSGARLNEVLSLELGDINLKSKPASIQIRGENSKTGDSRLSFISSEAAAAVNEWIKVRLAYIQSSANRNNGLIGNGMAKARVRDDQKLFPFSDQNANVIWDNALQKAGLMSRDRGTNRKQLHYHQLRKFFLSQLSLVISKEIAEMLAGHAGYLTGSYRRYTKKQLEEQYLKGERMLLIFGDPDIGEIREQLDSTTKDLQATKQGGERTATALSSVVLENQELKNNLESMKQQIESLKEQQAATSRQLEIIGNLLTVVSKKK